MVSLPAVNGALQSRCTSPWRWLTLFTVATPLTSGCLLTPPPDIEDPVPQRPNINDAQMVPPPWQLLNVQNGEAIPITVTFTAEDAGRELAVQLWRNWEVEDETRLLTRTIPPASEDEESEGQESGTNGSEERSFTFTWQVGEIPAGCQQFTLVLTPSSNLPIDDPQKPEDSSLVDYVTWWGNVDASDEEPLTLRNCPSEVGQSSF